jgi:hypothetical protein
MNARIRPMNIERLLTATVPICAVVALVAACSPDAAGLDSTLLEGNWESSTIAVSSPAVVESADTIDVAEVSPEEVEQAFERLVSRRVSCGREPSTCDVSGLALTGSRVHQQLSELMQERIDEGITASNRGKMTFEIESVEFDESNRAMVTTCLHDDTVLVIDGGVFDDSVYSARSVWTLARSDGEWLWTDERVIEWIMEGDLCGDQ